MPGTRIPLLLSLAGHVALVASVPGRRPPLPFVAGQAFSAAGDTAMALRTNRSTVAGITLFAGTHLCYLYGYLKAGALRRVPERPATIAAHCGTYPVIAALLWRHLDPMLRLPATAYGALLVTTAVAAWATDARSGLGATLFAASDVMIALRLAGVEFPSQRLLIYTTYLIGQYLVARHGANLMAG